MLGSPYIIVGQYRKSPGRAIVQEMISAMFNAPGVESPTNILRTVRIFLTRISSNSFQTKPGIGDTQKKILCIYLYTLFVAVCMPYVCIVYIYMCTLYVYVYVVCVHFRQCVT